MVQVIFLQNKSKQPYLLAPAYRRKYLDIYIYIYLDRNHKVESSGLAYLKGITKERENNHQYIDPFLAHKSMVKNLNMKFFLLPS